MGKRLCKWKERRGKKLRVIEGKGKGSQRGVSGQNLGMSGFEKGKGLVGIVGPQEDRKCLSNESRSKKGVEAVHRKGE